MHFNFWSTWPQSLKNILAIFGTVFFLSILYTFFTDLQGVGNILNWQIIGQRASIPIDFHDISLGNLTISLPVTNSIISETFLGSPIHINLIANYSFLLLLSLIIVLGITTISYLPRIWSLITNTIFVVMLWFFKFDQLGILELYDNTVLVLVAISYLGASYYFTYIRRDRDFIFRIGVFTAITFLWIITIGAFSEVERPFILLAANGFFIPYLVGLVFIMMVSHEILHFILIAISRPGMITGNNLTRYTIFSLIYLVNIILLLLYDTRVISWNFYYLNPYVLLGISSILGLWGLQNRKELFKKVQHYPILVFMYLVMGLCCFSTLFYFLGNSNDPILQVVKDVIIYSHFGFGSIFFIYIISNFMGIIRKNMPIEKIIYKPRNMPHFTFRFAGFMIVLGFALKENIEVPVHQSISGQYNNLGDYHSLNGDFDQAKFTYEEGSIYGYMNHKSNYALGKLYEFKDPPKAVEYYSNAIQVRPSEMAVVNLSSLWSKTGDLFNSLFILSDGQRIFPKSTAILNNKGHLFSKLNIPDSAIIYFDASFRSGTHLEPVTNYLGLLAKNNIGINADSIVDHYKASTTFSTSINALALKNSNNKRMSKTYTFERDSNLTLYSSSFYTNYFINQYPYIDSTVLYSTDRIAQLPQNSAYEEEVRYHTAISLYMRGHVNKSIQILENLSAIYAQNQAKYQYALGVIRSELLDFAQAKIHFTQAAAENYLNAEFAGSICRYIVGEQDSARFFWQNTADRKDHKDHKDQDGQDLSSYSIQLLKITNPEIELNQLSGYEKDLWIQLHPKAKMETVNQLLNSLSSDQNSASLILISSRLNRMGNFALADEYLARIKGKDSENLQRYETLKYLKLQLQVLQGDSIADDLILRDDLKLLYKATQSLNQEDSLMFRTLSNINAYNYSSVEKSMDFFRIHGEPIEPYSIIIDALRINPNSIPLLKLYVKECLNQYLSSYALNGLKSLYQLVDIEEYNAFILENTDQLSTIFGEEEDSINP